MRILIVGDVYSVEGRETLERNLNKLRRELAINLLLSMAKILLTAVALTKSIIGFY